MPEGYSNSAKMHAARGMIGSSGLELHVASADPGNDGDQNILPENANGYQHIEFSDSEIEVSAAGVITFPMDAKILPQFTESWPDTPRWAAVWTRNGGRFIANVDITDIIAPTSANTVIVAAAAFVLTPMP